MPLIKKIFFLKFNENRFFTFAKDFAPLSPIWLPVNVNVNNFQFCVDIFPRICARRSAPLSVILQKRRERFAILCAKQKWKY